MQNKTTSPVTED